MSFYHLVRIAQIDRTPTRYERPPTYQVRQQAGKAGRFVKGEKFFIKSIPTNTVPEFKDVKGELHLCFRQLFLDQDKPVWHLMGVVQNPPKFQQTWADDAIEEIMKKMQKEGIGNIGQYGIEWQSRKVQEHPEFFAFKDNTLTRSISQSIIAEYGIEHAVWRPPKNKSK